MNFTRTQDEYGQEHPKLAIWIFCNCKDNRKTKHHHLFVHNCLLIWHSESGHSLKISHLALNVRKNSNNQIPPSIPLCYKCSFLYNSPMNVMFSSKIFSISKLLKLTPEGKTLPKIGTFLILFQNNNSEMLWILLMTLSASVSILHCYLIHRQFIWVNCLSI